MARSVQRDRVVMCGVPNRATTFPAPPGMPSHKCGKGLRCLRSHFLPTRLPEDPDNQPQGAPSPQSRLLQRLRPACFIRTVRSRLLMHAAIRFWSRDHVYYDTCAPGWVVGWRSSRARHFVHIQCSASYVRLPWSRARAQASVVCLVARRRARRRPGGQQRGIGIEPLDGLGHGLWVAQRGRAIR